LEREKQEFEKRIINEMVPETFPLEQFKEWRDDPFSFKNQKQR